MKKSIFALSASAALLFASCEKVEEILTYDKATFSSVIVTKVASTSDSNLPWDLFDGPDLYFQVLDHNGAVLSSSIDSVENNVTNSSLPKTLVATSTVQSLEMDSTHTVRIYDKDSGGLDPDDLVAEYSFVPQDFNDSRNKEVSFGITAETSFRLVVDFK